MYLDLIKTPNLEYRRNRNTYILIDKSTGRLGKEFLNKVNIYINDDIELEDLNIISGNKRDAWDRLFKEAF